MTEVRPQPSSLQEVLEADLEELRRRGLQRRLLPTDATRIDVCSNDYLGLARDPRVVEAAITALRQHGAGGRASRLLGGDTAAHRQLEQVAAEWLECDATLFHASGYQANLGVLTTLVARGDQVFSDAGNHASLIDGCRLSGTRVQVFRHRDPEHLQELLCRSPLGQRRWIVTESIFSMDGDLAPLVELLSVARRHHAWLIVDEAHAVGLLGPQGRGAWAAAGLAPRDPHLAARIVTGGKALGGTGALVAAPEAVIRTLVHRARPFIYSTATSAATAAALHAAIAIVREDSTLRQRPLQLAARLAKRIGGPRPDAAIVPVVLGAEQEAVGCAEKLREGGFEAHAVRPPTVPVGTSRVRIACHAALEEADVDRLVALLPRVGPLPASPKRRAKTLVVAGTDTEIGKTVVSALVVIAARLVGQPRYWKPVQTGTDRDVETVTALASATPQELSDSFAEYPLPASPHEAAADAGASIDPEQLRAHWRRWESEHPDELRIAELAGGLLVPYTNHFTQIDLLQTLRPSLLLVARSGLGTLNHTLLSLEALRARRLEPRALVLVGPPHPSNRRTLAAMGQLRVFELPRFETLNQSALEGWIQENPDFPEIFRP